MSIKLQGTQRIEVDIKPQDIIDETIELVKRSYDIRYRFLSKHGTHVMEDDEYYHGSTSSHIVREADTNDIQAFETIRLLEELKRKV